MTNPEERLQSIYSRVDPETVASLRAFRQGRPCRRLVAGGTPWHYVTFGSGEAILFLHGMAGAYDIWWQVLERLGGQFRVLSLTYPAVDRLEDLAQGLTAILEEEGLESVNLVGSSLGGYLAQYLVASHPERIRAAVFANTFPPNEIITGRTRLSGRLLPLVPQGLLWYVLRQNTERKLYPASGYSEILRAYLLEQYSGAMSKAQFLARYRCVVEAFQPPDLEALGIPVLILEADNDPLVETTLREMLKGTYPSAEVHTLHAVGHFPYLNVPSVYADLLRGFFLRTQG